MILAPLDSRNIADQDYAMRGTKNIWDQHCSGILSMLRMKLVTYTMQPRPSLGVVDLASVFFSSPKLLAENVLFSKFFYSNRRLNLRY